MRALLVALSLAVTSALVGCGSTCPAPAAPTAQHDEARDREALMQADRDFAKATSERGLEGWVSFFTDDGVQFPNKKDVIQGKAAIRAQMTPLFSDPDLRLEWEPARADASGDLGWTIGHARLMHKEPDGSWTVKVKLKYLTVWHRQPDGTWKVAIDVGNEDAP